MDTDELLRAVVEFLRVWREQAPSRVSTSWGAIYRDDRFPLIHQANLGWVGSLPEECPAKILADLASTFRDTAVRHQAILFQDSAQAYAVQEDLARQACPPIAALAIWPTRLPASIADPRV